MSLPYVASAAEHQRLAWIDGGELSVLLDAARTDGQVAVLRSRPAGGSAAPVHVHPDEDEIVVLLSGRAVLWVGDERHELTDGGVAVLPRGVPHTYRFTSPTADLLVVCTPAGAEESFRSAGHDLATPVSAGWTLAPAGLRAAATANGQVILGPPLGVDDVMPAGLLAAGVRPAGPRGGAG